MHKTYLNKEEIKIIKGADKIIDKVGGFPSTENGRLIACNVSKSKDDKTDVELIFDITGWYDTLSYYMDITKPEYVSPYYHKEFSERKLRIFFHNCYNVDLNFASEVFGEIKFGGAMELKAENRHQDSSPNREVIIERPYCCFYIRSGNNLLIRFSEEECEISAELYQ